MNLSRRFANVVLHDWEELTIRFIIALKTICVFSLLWDLLNARLDISLDFHLLSMNVQFENMDKISFTKLIQI